MHPEESSNICADFNVAQTPVHQSFKNLVGGIQQINSDYDYFVNPAYNTTVATTSVVNNIVDVNNNRTSSRYHNVTVGNGGGGKNGSVYYPSHIYTNKVLPSSLLTKYTSAGSYSRGDTSMISAREPHHDSHNAHNSHHNNHNSFNHAYYSNNVTISNYGYQKNRYVPYNRNNTTHTSVHQSLHTPSTVTNSILTGSANCNQFSVPVYQACPPGLGPTLTSATPLSTISIQAPLYQQTKSSVMTTTTQCFSGPAEFKYAPIPTSSSIVNLNLPTSDNKKSGVSLATSVTTSSGGSGGIMTPSSYTVPQTYVTVTDPNDTVTLQITNLDFSMDEVSLKNFLLNQLKPITPVVSLTFEGTSYAKVTVPDLHVSIYIYKV